MGALVFVLVGVGIGAAIGISLYLKAKRRRELQAAATQMGLQLATDDPFGTVDLPFTLFSRGDGRGVENVLWGRWEDLDCRLFDYWYYDESTDAEGHRTKTYHRFNGVLAEIPADCPPISIAREGFFTRLADAVGLDDIGFELETFNTAFNVKSDDRQFAYALVDQRMMQWLLSIEKGWSFEVSGTWALCFSKRRRPTELVPLAAMLKAFREQIPRVVPGLYPRADRTA